MLIFGYSYQEAFLVNLIMDLGRQMLYNVNCNDFTFKCESGLKRQKKEEFQ